jgi:Flp pilus assembly secretin CpaC
MAFLEGASILSRGFVMTMFSLRGALGSAWLAIGLVFAPHLAAAEDLIVQYDQARLLRLPEPAVNIIIGNPSIADVTLQSSELLIITGKTFGVTNLIILDKDNKIILNQRLMVKSDDQKVVSLQRGISTTTYACVPKCEPVLKVGDEPNHFSEVAKAGQQKMKFSADSGSEEVAN